MSDTLARLERSERLWPLTIAWLFNMNTCNEALVLVWDRYRVDLGIPSIFG